MGRKKVLLAVESDTMELATHILHRYTTALLKTKLNGDRLVEAEHIGAGTYVRIGSIYGILTAQHVAVRLAEGYGLGVSISRARTAYSIPREQLGIHIIAVPKEPSFGPDLAFIRLPIERKGTIAASMSFYNLDRHKELMLHHPPKTTEGAWFLSGTPSFGTMDGEPESNFTEVKRYTHFALEGNLCRTKQSGEFDYAEMLIDFSKYQRVGRSLKGMSGGGLWQVLFQTDGKTTRVKSYLLAGVNFYQSRLVKDRRSMRSHFRRSLYDYAFNSISESFHK